MTPVQRHRPANRRPATGASSGTLLAQLCWPSLPVTMMPPIRATMASSASTTWLLTAQKTAWCLTSRWGCPTPATSSAHWQVVATACTLASLLHWHHGTSPELLCLTMQMELTSCKVHLHYHPIFLSKCRLLLRHSVLVFSFSSGMSFYMLTCPTLLALKLGSSPLLEACLMLRVHASMAATDRRAQST